MGSPCITALTIDRTIHAAASPSAIAAPTPSSTASSSDLACPGRGEVPQSRAETTRMDILETPRLILRHVEMRDLPGLLEIFSDPEAMRYYPSTKDEAGTRTWIERSLERYQRDGVGLWAVDI